MKTLTICNPDKYTTIVVKSMSADKPKIIGDNKDCFYFHSYNKEHLCIQPEYCRPRNKSIDKVKIELPDNGYIQLWDNMTLLE